jgi:hypothetical protein
LQLTLILTPTLKRAIRGLIRSVYYSTLSPRVLKQVRRAKFITTATK